MQKLKDISHLLALTKQSPLSLDIFGKTYKFYSDEEEDVNVGACNSYAGVIKIMPREADIGGDGCETYYSQVILHEIIHAVLDEAGHYELSDDEDLVRILEVLIPKIAKVYNSTIEMVNG